MTLADDVAARLADIDSISVREKITRLNALDADLRAALSAPVHSSDDPTSLYPALHSDAPQGEHQ